MKNNGVFYYRHRLELQKDCLSTERERGREKECLYETEDNILIFTRKGLKDYSHKWVRTIPSEHPETTPTPSPTRLLEFMMVNMDTPAFFIYGSRGRTPVSVKCPVVSPLYL